MQGFRSGSDPDPESAPHVAREFLLEELHFRTKDKLPPLNDMPEGRVDLCRERPVLSREIQEGNPDWLIGTDRDDS